MLIDVCKRYSVQDVTEVARVSLYPGRMVNECIMGCKGGGESSKSTPPISKPLSVFHFPIKKHTHLLPYWEKFVNRGAGWNAKPSTVLCASHFKDDVLNHSDQRTHLDWKKDPVPTVYVNEMFTKYPSMTPTPVTVRKPPRKRLFQEDEMPKYAEIDPVIHNLKDMERFCPEGFTARLTNDCLLFYRIVFDEKTQFPKVLESIKIDEKLHVQLQYNGDPVPLPTWFVDHNHGNAKLTRGSMVNQIVIHMQNIASESYHSLIDELKERRNYKPKGRPPYSAAMLRFALHLRYTSAQAYRLLLEKFPLPSFSLLNKLQQGGVDALKAIKLLKDKGQMSKKVILIIDEMYLQKFADYQAGLYSGTSPDGQLYKGIVSFMITGLKKSVPYVVQSLPEVTFTGEWLAKKIAECITTLHEAGFSVRGVVTDDHSTNVNAYSSLRKKYKSDSPYYFVHPTNPNQKIYLFFDSVHLMKNIRNNLLNGKKFVFPAFAFQQDGINVSCPAGYITWGGIHKVYDIDARLKANLRKAPKLTYKALHPGNKKQSVPLALALIEDTTIAAVKSYFPNRKDMSSFLEIFNKWWLISNSKERYHVNPVGNAVVSGDGKTAYFRALADWVEEWQKSPAFTLTPQTSHALIVTLRAQSMLIEELLQEDFKYVLVSRLQSDPLERRFSQYRQMSGGRFLVGLREVINSERILACRSLILEDIDFWKEDISPASDNSSEDALFCDLNDKVTEIQEVALDENSMEVSTMVAGYISKKLRERSKCQECKTYLAGSKDGVDHDQYLKILNRGGLTVPSSYLNEFVQSSFAVLDYAHGFMRKHNITRVRDTATKILGRYAPRAAFTCEKHTEWGQVFATKSIVNVFFNNQKKVDNDTVRKDTVVGFKAPKRQKTC